MTTRRAVMLVALGAAIAGVLVVAVVVRGWTPTRVLPTARGEHARAVADLERRVAAEDGWVVVPVPNLHEGGGTTTWWLHPCDPATDDERAVVRTAFHGSDVAGLPGHHEVERDTAPCTAPGRTVDLQSGRRLRLDVEMVALDGTWGLLEDRQQVTIEDRDLDAERVVAAGHRVVGPCDGRTAWSAWLHAGQSVEVREQRCVGSLGALPADAVAVHTFDGTSTSPRWLGPCGRQAPNGEGASRPEVDWFAGTVEVRERPCP